MMKNLLFLFIFFVLIGCSSRDLRQPSSISQLLELVPPDQSNVHFQNQVFEDADLNIITFEYLYNGAGVGVGDVNNDGWQDIFFAGNMVNSRLYLNKGQFQFEDITEQAGINTQPRWATGVAMVDINQDGWLDIYVSVAGPFSPQQRRNIFYINQQDGTFQDQAAALGLADTGHTTQANFFDYDLDGDLDVYLLTNITQETGPNIIRPKQVNGEAPSTDRLYRNDNGKFVDVSREAGILIEGYGLGVSTMDINRDGWPDIYISNDYLSNDLLYINNGDGTFVDRADALLAHTSYSAMGNDVADFNNDSFLDLVSLDMLPADNLRRKSMFASINYNRHRSELLSGYTPQYMRNTLQLNNGLSSELEVPFSEIGNLAGVAATDWSWSALFADMDNDGWKDLLVTNGYPKDITNMDFVSYKANLLMKGRYDEKTRRQLVEGIRKVQGAHVSNFAFQNIGNLQFDDQTQAWGMNRPSFSHGAAVADLDNDGDLDYVVNNLQEPAFIYKNKGTSNHYLRLKLAPFEENSLAAGTKVQVFVDKQIQYQEFSPYRGFQSSIEPFLHFGLGGAEEVDSIWVDWPNGDKQVFYNIRADQVLEVQHAANIERKSSSRLPGYFTDVTEQSGIDFQHEEAHYDDFRLQPLLPHKFSEEGPALAVSDVNGDGLEDFYIGGAFKQKGQLILQKEGGSWKSLVLGEGEAYEEEVAALFFDADGDGDQDLYVVNGGSEFPLESPYYQDKLYRNEGRAGFVLDKMALPSMPTSGSTVRAADFDGDGDLDLFVGGRCKPNRFPAAGRSYLLRNEEGRFRDVSAAWSPDLQELGMITDAQWLDYDQDSRPDLIVCGEWMGLEVFRNEGGKLQRVTGELGLAKSVGWWNTLSVADMDGDGDQDLVAGNLGLNSPLKTSTDQPLTLYAEDFDEDGRIDPIMTHYLQDTEVPVALRNDLLAWVLPLRRKFPDFKSYGQASWDEVFPGETLSGASKRQAHILSSGWWENQGSAGFVWHALPIEAQLAPVQTILVYDFNQDGKNDLLIAGNDFGTEPHTGRYDALFGQLLLQSPAGNFQAVPTGDSGLYLPGVTKNLSMIHTTRGPVILAAKNNRSLQILRWEQNNN